MNDIEQPLRNDRGRFVEGHKPINLAACRKKPGEVVAVHPDDPTRDTMGRLMQGPPQNVKNVKRMAELRTAFLEAVTTEQVTAVLDELVALTKPGNQPDIQLRAIALYLERVLGKPLQEIQVESNKVETTVNHHLHQLDDADLRQLESILSKTQPGHDGPEVVVST